MGGSVGWEGIPSLGVYINMIINTPHVTTDNIPPCPCRGILNGFGSCWIVRRESCGVSGTRGSYTCSGGTSWTPLNPRLGFISSLVVPSGFSNHSVQFVMKVFFMKRTN